MAYELLDNDFGGEIMRVVRAIQTRPQAIQCDAMRNDSAFVGAAACLGLITTWDHAKDAFGKRWRVTQRGLARIEEEDRQYAPEVLPEGGVR